MRWLARIIPLLGVLFFEGNLLGEVNKYIRGELKSSQIEHLTISTLFLLFMLLLLAIMECIIRLWPAKKSTP